jgi:Tfp pilus assembly protein PilO
MVYEDAGWPFWLRALIAIFAAGLVVVMGWRYYKRYWRK